MKAVYEGVVGEGVGKGREAEECCRWGETQQEGDRSCRPVEAHHGGVWGCVQQCVSREIAVSML